VHTAQHRADERADLDAPDNRTEQLGGTLTAWILTKGLQNLRAQVDAVFPDRDRASDGTIGDKAHQAEVSGHNPDDTKGSKAEWNGDPDSTPEVRAWDMDNDLAPGLDCQMLVDHLRSLPGLSSVIRYMIYNHKIYQASNGWRAETYTGASAHTEHVHFSGAYSQTSDNNTTYDYRLEDIPVALTAADKTWIQEQLATITAADKPQADGTPTSKIGRLVLSQGIPDGTDAKGARQNAWAVIENLGKANVALTSKVAELEAKIEALAPAKP
jgi:hypothetical protein